MLCTCNLNMQLLMENDSIKLWSCECGLIYLEATNPEVIAGTWYSPVQNEIELPDFLESDGG